MTKKVLTVLADGFEEIEAITCIDILNRASIDVTQAGLSDIRVKGAHNITILANKILDIKDNHYDAIILPGGMPGAKNLAQSIILNNILKIMKENNKIIAAICAAPAIVLAPLGILADKTATCYAGMENLFTKNTKYKEKDVVIDGNIVTSRGPATALPFALTLVELLAGHATAKQLRQKTLYAECTR